MLETAIGTDQSLVHGSGEAKGSTGHGSWGAAWGRVAGAAPLSGTSPKAGEPRVLKFARHHVGPSRAMQPGRRGAADRRFVLPGRFHGGGA
ncbi:MAG: hypothetical protein ACKOJF_33040, partial [Planctomycetaceae bacterium]